MRALSRSAPIDSTQRTVAIFDVLGVKAQILSGQSAQLVSNYQTLIYNAQTYCYNRYPSNGRRSIFLTEPPPCLLSVFSDTILIISSDETFDSALETIRLSWRILQTFISNGLALRGGLAFGEMFIDQSDQIVVGNAITTAHLLEQSQKWAGCAIDQSFLERFPLRIWSERSLDDVVQIILPMVEVPTKQGTLVANCINWSAELTIESGLINDMLRCYQVDSVEDLHPYLQETLSFRRSHSWFWKDRENQPSECGRLWVGDTMPPFPDGDTK